MFIQLKFVYVYLFMFMKFGQFMLNYKKNLKRSMKKVAWKLVPGPF